MSSLKEITDQACRLYEKHCETLYNLLWRTLQILGKQGVTFIIFVLCAKFLSPYEFGVYNYIFALIFMFAIFSDFGVSVAVSRYTAQYSISDQEKLQLLPFNAILIVVALSSVVCSVVFVFREHITYYTYIIYCLPMLFTIPLTSLYDGIYRGLKKFKQLSLINFIFGMLFVPLIYLSVIRWGIQGAIMAHNAYYLLLFLVIFGYSFAWKMMTKVRLSSLIIKEIFKYSLLVGLSDIGLFLYTRADVLVLGHFNLVEEIGYYEIVNRIFLILILPAQLLATVVAPKIAQIFLLQEKSLIRSNYARDVTLLFITGLLLAVVAYLGMGHLFYVLFNGYDQGFLKSLMVILLILLPFRFFSTYISIGYITPSGNVLISTVTIIIFGLFNVVLDFLLVGDFGVVGVVYATFFSQIFFILVKDLVFYFRVIRRY